MPSSPQPQAEPRAGSEEASSPSQAPGTEGERDSVTDVHGTVAHFEMAYSPPENQLERFGPPLRQLLGPISFLGFGLAMVGAVVLAQNTAAYPALSRWVEQQDRGRAISSLGLALVVLACAVGTLIRALMRGVVVRHDGVEARYLLAFGFPRVRRWTWAQVERIVMDDCSVMFELWNGSYERMPEVGNHKGLCDGLERAARARGIQVTKLNAARQRRRGKRGR
jgi:hypothetical protein